MINERIKSSANVISICPYCDSCVDCCQKGLVCFPDVLAYDTHLTYIEFMLAKIGNAGTAW